MWYKTPLLRINLQFIWLFIIILILYSHFCKTSPKEKTGLFIYFSVKAGQFMIGSLEFGWPGYQEKINKTYLKKTRGRKRYVTLSRSSGAIPRLFYCKMCPARPLERALEGTLLWMTGQRPYSLLADYIATWVWLQRLPRRPVWPDKGTQATVQLLDRNTQRGQRQDHEGPYAQKDIRDDTVRRTDSLAYVWAVWVSLRIQATAIVVWNVGWVCGTQFIQIFCEIADESKKVTPFLD